MHNDSDIDCTQLTELCGCTNGNKKDSNKQIKTQALDSSGLQVKQKPE